MIKINEFIDFDIRITWKLLYLGYKGNCVFSNQIAKNDILDYALYKLEDCDCSELVTKLASEYENNTESI